MKELRGTILALMFFGGLVTYYYLSEEKPITVKETKLFSFEKHDVIKAKIIRPDGLNITIYEKDSKWWIEETNHRASTTMVNRIRHQLHDLEARANVTTDQGESKLYGLGKSAIKVVLNLKDGREISFLAGDPNPTGVSYYIQPLPGNSIYTVKKSALDYYSADYDQFRDQRILRIETKDVEKINVGKKNGENWSFSRIDETRWNILAPFEERTSKDIMRTLIGRCIALKAKQYVDPDEQKKDYGLQNPLLKIEFVLSTGVTKTLMIGDKSELDGFSYFKIEDEPIIYIAKHGLLEEFDFSAEKLRNKRVVDLNESEITSMKIRLREEELSGETEINFAAGKWFWKNGNPVSGSTPRRLASGLNNLEVLEFVDKGELGDVVLDLEIESTVGSRHVQYGQLAEPYINNEGREYPRRYMTIEDGKDSYIVDEHVLGVARDAIREFQRAQK